MKTKQILIIVSTLAIGILFYYFKYVYGWLEFRRDTDTPENFLNYVQVTHQEYYRDSVIVINELKVLLKNRKDFFQNSAYFDSTQLIVDSILYNQALDKVAVFVLAKNPTYRQLSPNNENMWYYDATCFLGNRKGQSIELIWVGPVLTNAENEKDASKYIRDACFRHFVSTEGGIYLYNVNDVRFWSSPIWKKIKSDNEKKEVDTMEIKSSDKIVSEN